MSLFMLCKRRLRAGQLAIPFAILLFCLSGCVASSNTPSPSEGTTPSATTSAAPDESFFPVTIVDAVGQEFTFDEAPKLGCWWAGCVEMLADMGLVPHASSYTDENASSVFFYPLGVPAHNIADTQNPENWAASEVDLLLMRVPDDPANDPLKAAAPIFYLHHPSYGESAQTGYQAFVENLHLLGQLTGQPAAADAAIARFATLLANLKALATPETQALTVAVLFDGEGYRFIAPGNPFCVALAEVGLGNCVGEGAASTETNAEEFLSLDPDWIVYQIGDGLAADRTDPVWSQLTAVKAGHVYDAQGHRYYCCSLRGLTHALQEYVHYVLPDANIPAPGLWLDFDPLQSPLVTATSPAAPNASTTGTTRTYTDAFERTVEVPENPQRIIAHYYAADMVALDLPMIGTNFVNAELALTAEQLQGVEDVGEYEPNLEKIVTLSPDLIFVPDFMEAATVDRLSEIAPTVVIPYSGDPFTRLRLFGEIAGKPEVAEAWINAYNAKAETQRAEVEGSIAPGETAMAVIMYSDSELYIYGHPRLGLTLYDVFGFTQPPAVTELFKDDPDALWQAVSMELLPEYVSDRIFLVQADDATAQQATQAMIDGPLWQSLPAVQNGKVYAVDGRWALNDPLTLDWLLDEMTALLAE